MFEKRRLDTSVVYDTDVRRVRVTRFEDRVRGKDCTHYRKRRLPTASSRTPRTLTALWVWTGSKVLRAYPRRRNNNNNMWNVKGVLRPMRRHVNTLSSSVRLVGPVDFERPPGKYDTFFSSSPYRRYFLLVRNQIVSCRRRWADDPQ